MKTLALTCLAAFAAVSTMGQAQTINTSHSRSVALSGAQNLASEPALATRQPAMLRVMTRAVAHRDANGELVVKCHVEPSPIAAGPRGRERTTTHKKVN